jgi:hypothetical protein
MADAYKATKKRINEAYALVKGQKKPNISQLARDFDVLISRLRARL